MQELDPKAAKQIKSRGQPNTINLTKLKDALKKAAAGQKATPSSTADRLSRFEPRVQQHIGRIEKFLASERMTTEELHRRLDANGDGVLEKHEFVGKIQHFRVPGLIAADLGLVFDALDLNGDGALSLSEFKLFLEGSKRNRADRLRTLDPEIVRGMREEI